MFSATFECGAGVGGFHYATSTQSEDLRFMFFTRAATGFVFNVAASPSALVSFGPTVGAEAGFISTSFYLTYLFGFDLRFTLPLRLPPPPPPVRRVRIDSSVRVQATGDEAEITQTPSYRQTLPTVRHVAVRAPSNCEDARATSVTGQTAGVGSEILHTTCGVEMAELERRLALQGFIVTSWTTLSSMAETQRITPLDAARQLGAQVVFQVNSLERTRGNVGRVVEWEQVYRETNEYGDPGSPVALSDADRGTIRAFLREAEVNFVSSSRLGASLDVNAISVATGQSIWFFRWNHLQPFENQGRVTGFAMQVGDRPWVPVTARAREVPDAAPTVHYSSRDTQRMSEAGIAADAQQAQYSILVREAIDRFVTSFSPNRVVAEVPPTPEPVAAVLAPAAAPPPAAAPQAVDTPEVTTPAAPSRRRRHRHRHRAR